MRFYVEGDLEKGTVHLHCAKRPGEDEYEYRYLYLDVPGMFIPLSPSCRAFSSELFETFVDTPGTL